MKSDFVGVFRTDLISSAAIAADFTRGLRPRISPRRRRDFILQSGRLYDADVGVQRAGARVATPAAIVVYRVVWEFILKKIKKKTA